jgi:LysM repeat protein
VAKQPIEPDLPDAADLPDAPDVPEDHALEPEPDGPRRGGAAETRLPWVFTAVVVLLLAVSAGLIAAWVVASLKAVPIPPGAIVTASPVPGATDVPSSAPTPRPSEQPRRTPTPSPHVTQEPEPFVHVVQRGDSLSYLADLYGVTVEEIVALNDIQDPNRIRVGRELLIPGYGNRPSPSP